MTPVTTPLHAPLSFGQEQWWLLDQIEPGNTGNNVAVPLRLRGRLDLDAIERIGNLWRRRHETLRTRILRHDGALQQVVMPYEAQPLKIIDLSHLPPAEREATAQCLTNEDAQYLFDLRSDSPIRLSILRLADDEHIWLRTIHHIACDGWSVNVLLREAAAYYNAFSAEPSPTKRNAIEQELLPFPPLTYSEYARRQRADEGIEAGLTFWKQRLGNNLQALEPILAPEQTRAALPQESSPPDTSLKHLRHSVSIEIPPEIVADFKEFCRQQNATFFTALLAAFAALLHRIGGQEHFIIGTGVADRGRRDTRDLVGFLVSTLALAHDLSGDPTFAELLAREGKSMQEAFSHAHVPFRRVVEELAPQRHAHSNLLFQTLVVAVPPTNDYPLSGLVKIPWQVETGGTMRGLLLQVKQFGADLSLRFDYDCDYFDRIFVERLAARFAHLLETLPVQVNTRLSQLDILPASERATLDAWAQGPVTTSPPVQTLQELAALQAQATSDAIALQSADGTMSLTYAQLWEQALDIATHLRGAGVMRGQRVGICAGRTPQSVIAVLGILFAGATVVPLDATLPGPRLQAIATDAQLRAVLALREFAEKFAATNLGIAPEKLLVFEEIDFLAHKANSLDHGSGEDVAYLLYTSGSTGTPKGVAMPHRALVNLMEWQKQQSIVFSGPAPRTLQFAPLSFDVAWQEIFSTWGSGGTLIVADDTTRLEPEALLRLLEARQVERLFLPFVALQQLAWAATRSGQFPTALREVISAGEQLLITPQIRSFFEQIPGCRLHNHYGPTETHVVTHSLLQGDSYTWPERPTIGRPIANAHVSVVDEHGNPLPIGLTGEISIAGVPVAHGYWNAPGLTRERFTEGRYRTGDLGRWRHNGELEFLGRGDTQLKVRGYRVEPGDIENALLRHPAIAQAAVVAQTAEEADSGHTRLTAYFVARPDSGLLETSELRHFLLEQLPEYMVPAAFVALNTLPLTASGKTDRRALASTPPATLLNRVFVSVGSNTLGTFEDGKL